LLGYEKGKILVKGIFDKCELASEVY